MNLGVAFTALVVDCEGKIEQPSNLSIKIGRVQQMPLCVKTSNQVALFESFADLSVGENMAPTIVAGATGMMDSSGLKRLKCVKLVGVN